MRPGLPLNGPPWFSNHLRCVTDSLQVSCEPPADAVGVKGAVHSTNPSHRMRGPRQLPGRMTERPKNVCIIVQNTPKSNERLIAVVVHAFRLLGTAQGTQIPGCIPANPAGETKAIVDFTRLQLCRKDEHRAQPKLR